MIEVSKVLEDRIDIALATYNGEKYITELLDSLDQQTYQNFIVHVCDDGSKDQTIAICEAHSLFKKGKLEIHEKLGVMGPQGILFGHFLTVKIHILRCVIRMIFGFLPNLRKC